MDYTHDPLSSLPTITRLMCAALTGTLLAIGFTSIVTGQYGDLFWLALLPVAESTRDTLWLN